MYTNYEKMRYILIAFLLRMRGLKYLLPIFAITIVLSFIILKRPNSSKTFIELETITNQPNFQLCSIQQSETATPVVFEKRDLT